MSTKISCREQEIFVCGVGVVNGRLSTDFITDSRMRMDAGVVINACGDESHSQL
ncbi:MAG: hypothetical protein ACYC6R_04395 [Anaerolineales bacterium]